MRQMFINFWIIYNTWCITTGITPLKTEDALKQQTSMITFCFVKDRLVLYKVSQKTFKGNEKQT